MNGAFPLAREQEAGSKEHPRGRVVTALLVQPWALDLLIRERERMGMEGNEEGKEGKRRRCGAMETLRW
jgi:hypothetical protein